MTKSENIKSIENATNRSWDQWLTFLKNDHQTSHTEIAKKVAGELGNMKSAGWWAQAVTVAFEQSIGRRAPGQRADGTYEISVKGN